MSRMVIYRVKADGEVRRLGEASNAWGGAMLIWTALCEANGLGPIGYGANLEPLWSMFGKGKLSRRDEIILGMTFDRVWVKRETVPELVEAMRSFYKQYGAGKVATLLAAADVLQKWFDEHPDDRGVAFNQTSVSESLWSVYIEEEDEKRPYNIDTDTKGHWELTDALSA